LAALEGAASFQVTGYAAIVKRSHNRRRKLKELASQISSLPVSQHPPLILHHKNRHPDALNQSANNAEHTPMLGRTEMKEGRLLVAGGHCQYQAINDRWQTEKEHREVGAEVGEDEAWEGEEERGHDTGVEQGYRRTPGEGKLMSAVVYSDPSLVGGLVLMH
jgi:hypothetical protein